MPLNVIVDDENDENPDLLYSSWTFHTETYHYSNSDFIRTVYQRFG